MGAMSFCHLSAVAPTFAQEADTGDQVLTVRVLGESNNDPRTSVQWSVLDLALQKSGRPFDLGVSTVPTGPDRTSGSLTKNGDEGNVVWGGARPERELEKLVVHIPVLRGLMQYWLIWARKDRLPDFAGIRTAEDLAQFSVLQGLKWSTIPAFNKIGISPIEADTMNLPNMLAAKRADLFPYPAIGSKNLLGDQMDALAPLPNVMLVWPGEHFFMVDRNNQALHDAIYDGMLRSFEDGSYNELVRSHPDSSVAFKYVDLDAIDLIRLENPYTTPEADAALAEFAVTPKEIFGDMS